MRLISIRAFGLGTSMLLAGTGLGWCAANSFLHARFSMGAMGESAAFAQIAAVRYDNADYDAARFALRSYLSYLDSQSPARAGTSQVGDSPWLDARMIAADTVLVLGRLALLEERHQNIAGAEPLWLRAETEAKAAGWSDSSRRRIRDVLQRIDSRREPQGTGSQRDDGGANRR
jgi:hypothetical protein